MPLTQFEESEPFNSTIVLVNANGTSAYPLVAARDFRLRIDYGRLLNSDTIDHVVNIFSRPGGVLSGPVGSVLVPAGAGFGGLAVVEFGAFVFQYSGGIVLQPSDLLYWSVDVAVVDPNEVWCFLQGGKV